MSEKVGKNIVKIIEQTIDKFNMLKKGDKVIIGLSGGADSTSLAYALNELKSKLGIDLYILHINHKLRGKESELDEAYSKNIAENFNIPFYSESLSNFETNEKNEKKNKSVKFGSFEADLREKRLIAFQKVADKIKANVIALAHHQDDLVETILFRFLRGSGPYGLAGFEPVSIYNNLKIIRPLYEISKNEIIDYLKKHKINWREDKSNKSYKITRNRIRHELIPYLERFFNPSVKEAVLRFGKICVETRKAIAFLEEIYFNQAKELISDNILLLKRENISEYPDFLQNLVFRKALQETFDTGYPPEEQFVRMISEEWIKNKTPLIIKPSKNLIIIIDKKGIYFWKITLKRILKAEKILSLFEECLENKHVNK